MKRLVDRFSFLLQMQGKLKNRSLHRDLRKHSLADYVPEKLPFLRQPNAVKIAFSLMFLQDFHKVAAFLKLTAPIVDVEEVVHLKLGKLSRKNKRAFSAREDRSVVGIPEAVRELEVFEIRRFLFF